MVIQWFPGHMAKATREVKEKLKLVDIVFELVDARCPLSSHNMYLDEVVKDKKKIIIFNKIDLCDRAETAKWKSYFENKGYTVVYTDAKNSNNLNKVIDKAKEELAEKIARQVAKGIKPRAIRSMVIGVPNVGKSTFINKLIELTTGDKNVITTSHFPGTTLGMIEIPLDRATSIYDTPGIILDYDIAHYLDAQSLKLVMPKKEIKARVFQLNAEQSLFFGGMARMDFVEGERQSFTLYASNLVEIHRTKLSNADQLFEKHLGTLLKPPFEDNISIFNNQVKKSFTIDSRKMDIVISGLGWITVNSDSGCKIDIHVPEEIEVFVRESII